MKVALLLVFVFLAVVVMTAGHPQRDERLFGWSWEKKPVKEISVTKGWGWKRPSIKGVGIYGGIRVHHKDPGGKGWGGGWGLRIQQGWGSITEDEPQGWSKPSHHEDSGWGWKKPQKQGWGWYHGGHGGHDSDEDEGHGHHHHHHEERSGYIPVYASPPLAASSSSSSIEDSSESSENVYFSPDYYFE